VTKIYSWNLNGIRAASNKGLVDWLKKSRADIYCLQEVRASEDQIPKEVLRLGLYKSWFKAVKKGYSGVAILSKKEPINIIKGIDDQEYDCEGRVITAEFADSFVLSAYFPNSQDKGKRIDYKLGFCRSLQKFLKKLAKKKKSIILAGDYNIAHKAVDLARPDSNENSPGYLPQEREWMSEFLDSGWVDTFRQLNPKAKDKYSWWSMRTRARDRNIGWRIDYNCIDEASKGRIVKANIKDKVLGSDHCPVYLEIE